MAVTAAAELSVAATLEAARDQFLLHLAGPVLRHERALREGTFPWQEAPEGGPADVRGYPVLERTIAAWTEGWTHSHALLAERFARDWPGLRIEAISPYRSDPHHGGQAVAILAVSGGPGLVYKPRPLSMEAAFGRLLGWINDRGFRWPFRRAAVVERDGYGWMEHVAAEPCGSIEEVEAFYARAGGLLFLLALLQATDIHHENLIAAGRQPVLVDLETLFQPRATTVDFAGALAETGFLPMAGSLDFSALGATEEFDTPFRYRVPLRENVATLGSRRETAAMHADAVLDGFAEAFTLVRRDDPRELLQGFAGLPVRMVRRASNDYGLLLQESRQPQYMRDAALRRSLFARLRDVTEEELEALERMDVPYFTAACDPAPAIAAYEALHDGALPSLLAAIRHALKGKGERDHGP